MPIFVEALGAHVLTSLSDRPQLASLPLCVSPIISKPANVSLDGKEHPRSVSALRCSACAPNALLMSNAYSVHLGAHLRRGRLPCLARVGPYVKSKAHSAALPHDLSS
ncbi:UNVERIFIED_CONTAM: hypothetical protein Sradi_4927500 [Sesamum radiatum]|uniref:C2H2-type domain-containing protein n=1 Tax=Sesamum radiatum TaxID=300843 RepID=A0AAW2MG85_SESRA